MTNSLRPSFNEYERSAEGPVGITLPQTILSVFNAIARHEQAEGRTAQSGFYFGGLFTSLMRGEKPHDVDIVVCAPEIVEMAAEVCKLESREVGSYFEMNFMRDEVEQIKSRMFPYGDELRLDPESMQTIGHWPGIGAYFQVRGTYTSGDYSTGVDILFVREPVDGAILLTNLTDAPVRSIGFDPASSEFVYHRDFPKDAQEWVYRPFSQDIVKPQGLKKAQDKGMTIVMP